MKSVAMYLIGLVALVNRDHLGQKWYLMMEGRIEAGHLRQ